MLVIVPTADREITQFTINYIVEGDEYPWWQKLIIGENGQLYFYIAVVCAGLIVVILLAILILCCVRCCRKKDPSRSKVEAYDQNLNDIT